MPAQDIKSIIYGNFSNYSDEMLMHVGEGFLTGKGYPRNEAIGLKILNYLAIARDADGISHTLAQHYLEKQNYTHRRMNLHLQRFSNRKRTISEYLKCGRALS